MAGSGYTFPRRTNKLRVLVLVAALLAPVRALSELTKSIPSGSATMPPRRGGGMADRKRRPATVGNRLKSASRGFVVVGIVVLAGCHAKQVTEQFSVGFDQAIGRLYETHVLNNLARCDNDEFFVQMTFGNFGSDLTRTGSLSAQVVLWGNRTNPDSDQEVLFGLFEQSYSPTVSQSQSARLGFTASPASGQSAILAMYRGEVERPTEERFFRVTHKLAERLNAYCSTRRGIDEWCVVPQDRRREFCEFVHRVSFYEPPAATQPAVPDGAAASDASAAP